MKLYLEEIQNSNISILGNWLDNDLNLINHPFNHIIIDNFLKDEYFDKIIESLPNTTHNFWEYMNPLRSKIRILFNKNGKFKN